MVMSLLNNVVKPVRVTFICFHETFIQSDFSHPFLQLNISLDISFELNSSLKGTATQPPGMQTDSIQVWNKEWPQPPPAARFSWSIWTSSILRHEGERALGEMPSQSARTHIIDDLQRSIHVKHVCETRVITGYCQEYWEFWENVFSDLQIVL